MTRTLGRKVVMAILLAMPITEGLAQCHSRDSNDQKLELLNQPLDRNNHDAVECAFALMDDLTNRGDLRVMPVLIRNLDLEQMGPVSFNITRSPLVDLAAFGEKADPLLLDAIDQASMASLLSENAIAALMLIHATDPCEGIRKLLARAATEKGEAAAKMRVAAEYSVSFCYSKKKQACEDMIWPNHLRNLPNPPPK